MAPPVEVKTRREAPARAAASSTFTVPTTLRRASKPGSAIERRTSICAARWKTLPGPNSSIVREDRPGVGDVELGELRARLERPRQVLPLAAREVVQHEDLVPARGQSVDQMGADEARAACHHRSHAGRAYGRKVLSRRDAPATLADRIGRHPYM